MKRSLSSVLGAFANGFGACFVLFLILFAEAASTAAQTQQPFVFSTSGATFTRNDQTGVLTPTSGSPSAPAVFMTIDVQGRFLFGIGTNSIHMYAVDSSTGAFHEVSTSPFASANTKSPIFIAVESSGKYLAVANETGLNQSESSVETFFIDAANQQLTPVDGSFYELDSTIIDGAPQLNSAEFYLYLGVNNFNTQNEYLGTNSELDHFTIDPSTGYISATLGNYGNVGRCFAKDPKGRFVVLGHGENVEQIEIVPTPGGLLPA